jgi:nucleoside-diphosphate-sugar epimerase
MTRKRRFPLVGDAGAEWSFIQVADAAEGTTATIEHASRGVYNVVDDDPAAVAEWRPALPRSSAPGSRGVCPGGSGDGSPGRPAW